MQQELFTRTAARRALLACFAACMLSMDKLCSSKTYLQAPKVRLAFQLLPNKDTYQSSFGDAAKAASSVLIDLTSLQDRP